MKIDLFIRVHKPNNHPSASASALLMALALATTPAARAQAEDAHQPPAASAAPAKAEKRPPLPLHQIEGNGGIFATLSAYLVDPPRDGEAVGRPSVGFSFVDLGYGRDLEALTLTETPWKRLELGFGYIGNVLNHNANGVWGITTKWEF